MRRALMLAALVAARPLVAQTPAVELRLIAAGLPSTRSASLDGSSVTKTTGTMGGGEFALRLKPIGVSARFLSGALDGSSSRTTVATADVRAQLGPRLLALEGGYGVRALSGQFGTAVHHYLRAGVASVIPVGTRLVARMSASLYLPGGNATEPDIAGQDISTSLELQIPRTPFVIAAGYRAEVFIVKAAGGDRPEHVAGLLFGGGMRFAK